MKTKIALFALTSLVATPAFAGKFNLSEYKTVAVQPVLSASNTRGQFESELAAQAASYKFQPGAASLKSLGGRADSKSGFGFAGTAQTSDIQLLFVSLGMGLTPGAMQEDAADLKAKVPMLKQWVGLLQGKVNPKVVEALNLAIAAIEVSDLQNTVKACLVAMALSADSIAKGSERVHGYVATGLYIGVATAFVRAGQQNQALANIATPLVALLEQDAVMGGADRAVAAQLKIVAGELASATPDATKAMGAIAAIQQIKPD